MKTKIIFYLLVIFSFSKGFSQTYNQAIKLLGRTYNTAKSNYCQDPFSTNYNKIINVHMASPLSIGSVYKMDVDSDGGRYYKIVSANLGEATTAVDDIYANDIIESSVSFNCNGFKYHRILDLGSTLTEATNKYCTPSTALGSRVNILIDNPLIVGNVYQIDQGNGLRYHKVIQAESVSNQDASEDIDGSNIGSSVTITCPEPPDLKAISLSINSTNQFFETGEKIPLNYKIKNLSKTNATSSYELEFTLSDNKFYDSNDILRVNGRFYPSIDPDKIISGSEVNVSAPKTISGGRPLPEGSYYIIMRIIPYGEDLNNNNNIISIESSIYIKNTTGNPPTPTGNPDLIVDKSKSTAKSTGSTDSTSALSSNKFHTLYSGESLDLKLEIKNEGEINSNSMKVGIYVNSSSGFDNSSLLRELNYSGSILPNSNQSQSIQISGGDIDGYADFNGRAYIHIVVDKNNNVDEGNTGGEDNNIYSSIPVYVKRTSRTGKSRINKDYTLKIMNWSGKILYSGEVSSKKEEEHVINNLNSRGTVIINTNGQSKQRYLGFND